MPDERNGTSRRAEIAAWVLQVVVVLILGQTLFFKFTGAPESRWIFEQLGAEPWGRWASGLAELSAIVLLLLPRGAAFGALLALGVMAGAIGSHLLVLGVEVQGDGGTLFALALVTLLASAGVAFLRRSELPGIGRTPARRTSRG